jgi:hypothetical protein
MVTITKYISSSFDSARRRIIKVLKNGKWDVQTPIQASPAGVDSGPVKKNIRAIYCESEQRGRNILLGYIDTNQLAESGEIRIYSSLEDSQVKAYVWCKKDGILLLNGDANFAVKFNELKEAFDELQDDVNTLKQNFSSWIPIPNDGGAALKSAAAAWSGTTLVKNIDDAKNANIKTS